MSHGNYAIYGFGLIFIKDEINTFIKDQIKYNIHFDPNELGYSDEDESDIPDFFTEFTDDIRIKVNREAQYIEYGDYEGLYYRLLNNHSGAPDEMFVIYTDKQPDIFNKNGYENINEIQNEFTKEFVFPDDFDWEAHLGFFDATLYS